VHRDAARHHVDEPARDRESEAGAAKPSGDREVRLLERFEQPLDMRRIDADARVAHADQQLAALQRDLQVNTAALGEFHGIRKQVRDHLAEPQRVAHALRGHRGVDRNVQFHVATLDFVAEQRRCLAHDASRVDRHLLDPELACLDLGEIEHVVHDA
jgi:hypothetical protein